jgi:large repetitive protein
LIRDSIEGSDFEQQYDRREASNDRPQLVVAYRSLPDPGTTPPETLIIAGPPSTTSSTSAQFRFTANEVGSTFECDLDGSGFVSCTSPKDYTGLSEGQHTFQVRATDPTGNTDPTPATFTWNVLGSIPPPTPAPCGLEVTESLMLAEDMLDCPGDGLVIGADNVNVDLNGKTIDGVGLGAGVRNEGFSNVTITNGTIQHFDEGVRLGEGTEQTVVSDLTVRSNDLVGIELSGAGSEGVGDEVRGNTITDNGVGVAVALVAGSGHNLLVGNDIEMSSAAGLRVDSSSANTIRENTIDTDGDAGVELESSGRQPADRQPGHRQQRPGHEAGRLAWQHPRGQPGRGHQRHRHLARRGL